MRFELAQKIIDKLRGKAPTPPFNTLSIEISGLCNAKCKWCCSATGNHPTKTKFMTAEKFEKILKHLIKNNALNTNAVELYRWSEPFLNPELNEILEIIGKYNMVAVISSNFIKFPEQIKPENYKYIQQVGFSICSLDKEKYKYMYGHDLDKVLNNYDRFIEMRNKYNPEMNLVINFIQYKFSYSERQQIHDYFKSRDENIYIPTMIAHISDSYEMMKFFSEDKVDSYDREQLEKDIDLKRWRKLYEKGEITPCPFIDKLNINESGELSLCCVITARSEGYNLGDILSMKTRQMYDIPTKQPYCNYCIQKKGTWFIQNVIDTFPKPLLDYNVEDEEINESYCQK